MLNLCCMLIVKRCPFVKRYQGLGGPSCTFSLCDQEFKDCAALFVVARIAPTLHF